MNLISIRAALLAVLSIFGSSGAAPSTTPLIKLSTYHIVKKPIHTVSEKFLSFTADPNMVSRVAECTITNATLNMAKSLTPAYFRLAGADSNRFLFQSNPNTNNTELTSKSKIFSVSNADWLNLNTFLSKTGMSVVAGVSGVTESLNKDWDLSNALELITFSDKHNLSLDWQLGYELQKIASSSQGKLMGHDVSRLRKILDVFPRYRKSLIIGPDMTSFKSQNDAIFVRNYLTEAADSLDVFTWHPFSKSSEDNEIVEMLSNGMTSMDTYLWIKDGLVKSASKGVVPRKSIWIAESENADTVSNLTDSITWIIRMGASAKLGASVYLRKPHLLSFYEPTPEYWTAVLYKSLVGRTVLDIKQTSGNGTNQLHMFTHCTKFIDKPEESIINPEISYDPGSITVYGVNMASESTRISFKIGFKSDESAHLYILTEDTSGDFPKTLLNKQPLDLSSENELPMISPRVRESPKYLLIPARSIFFVVFPNTNCRSCNEFDTSSDASKTKIKVPTDEENLDTNTFTSNILEKMEDDNDQDHVYVNYPKRVDNVLQIPTDSETSFTNTMDSASSQTNVKYRTFTDDTWLDQFPEKFKDIINKDKDGTADMKDKTKAEKYRILAQAMLGKRTTTEAPKESPKSENSANRFLFEDGSESNEFKRAVKNFNRWRRSVELVSGAGLESKDDLVKITESLTGTKSESKDDLVNPTAPVSATGSDSKDDLVQPTELVPGTKLKSKDEHVKPTESISNIESQSEDDLGPEPDVEDYLPELLADANNTESNFGIECNDPETTVDAEDPSEVPEIALYIYDQQDNETRHSETSKPLSFSKINGALLINKTDIEQIMNSTEFEETIIPIITFVKKSTLENMYEAANDRVKREIPPEGTVIFQPSNGLLSNSTRIPYSLNSSKDKKAIDDSVKDIVKHMTKLVESFLQLDIFSDTLRNKSTDALNKTQTKIYAILTRAMLAAKKTPNITKESPNAENPATRFVLESDIRSDEFIKALNNFDRFKRSLEPFPANKLESKDDLLQPLKDETDTIESQQKITKREGSSSSISKSPVDMSARDISLYLFDEQDSEPRYFQTEKRSAHAKIYAVPLNEDNLQMALKNNEFRETIPIITFVKKPMLEGIVEAANDRVKREATILENSTTSESSKYSTASPTGTPSLVNSTTKVTSPITPENDKLIEDSNKALLDGIMNLTQSFYTTTIPSAVNLSMENSTLSELAMESDGSEISRGLREVNDKQPQTVGDNGLGARHLKPNPRPVSPFPKKPKNVKSKLPKSSIKPKSSENLQLNQQPISTTSSASIEPIVSTKLSAPEITAKSANIVQNSELNDDPAAAVRKFRSEISKNLQESSQIHQASSEDNSSAAEKSPNSGEVVFKAVILPSKPIKPSYRKTLEWEMLSKARTKVPAASRTKTPTRPVNKPPKMTPQQIRLSYEQRKKQIIQKHLARLDEIRNLLRVPESSPSRLHKRHANMMDDAFNESKSFFNNLWESVKSWDPNTTAWISEQVQKISDTVTNRSKRQVEDYTTTEQYPFPSVESKHALNRKHYMAVSPRIIEVQKKNITIADYAHQRNKDKVTLAKDRAYFRNRRDLQKLINQLKEDIQTRNTQHRQKLNKILDEIKQRQHRSQKAIFANRNKRDIQAIHDKLRELRKKKQDYRHELHQKPVFEHASTQAPFKSKIIAPIIKVDESRLKSENKTIKKHRKLSEIKKKFNHMHAKREVITENHLEEEVTSPSDLQKYLKLHLFVDPELNTPQSIQQGIESDDLDRLKRSLTDNEIFDENDEIGIKLKNKDQEGYHYSENNKIEESSTATFNPSTDTKYGIMRNKSNLIAASTSSQANQTCQLTNYNVFKYLWCLAQRIWYTYFNI